MSEVERIERSQADGGGRMSDLIDRKSLIKSIWLSDRTVDICQKIERAPAVDAVPVVHGRWRFRSNAHNIKRSGDYEEWYECTACGLSSDGPHKYCPDCGAKMDGEKKVENNG